LRRGTKARIHQSRGRTKCNVSKSKDNSRCSSSISVFCAFATQRPSGRDRDRLRQQQLENLGWRFHRIWSTDWFMRKEEEIQRTTSDHAPFPQNNVSLFRELDAVTPPVRFDEPRLIVNPHVLRCLVRHRQTKEPGTDRLAPKPPRHISTPPPLRSSSPAQTHQEGRGGFSSCSVQPQWATLPSRDSFFAQTRSGENFTLRREATCSRATPPSGLENDRGSAWAHDEIPYPG